MLQIDPSTEAFFAPCAPRAFHPINYTHRNACTGKMR